MVELSTETLPLGCHLGIWHRWGKWSDYGVVTESSTVVPSGLKIETGRLLIQKRECHDCAAVDFRRVRS